MNAVAKRYPEIWRRRTPRESLVAWLTVAAVAFASAWSVSALDIEWAFFADAHEQAADLVGRMWPPRWSYLPTIVAPLLETIHIAILGTAIAVVFSVPIAFLAARNTTLNGFTWAVGRGLLFRMREISRIPV